MRMHGKPALKDAEKKEGCFETDFPRVQVPDSALFTQELGSIVKSTW
jgi:hypothetical protein